MTLSSFPPLQHAAADVVARGHEALEAGDLARAAGLAAEALGSQPTAGPAKHLAGLVAFEQGRLETAAEHFAAAVRDGTPVAAYFIHLGATLGRLRQFEDAAVCFRRALVLDPQDADAYFNLAAAYRGQGDLPASIAALCTALYFRPTFVEASFNLANALRDMGDSAEAVSVYRQALAIRPGYLKAMVNLGNLLVRLGREEEGVPLLERAAAGHSTGEKALRSLAAAYGSVGRTSDAVEAARRAVAASPDNYRTHAALAVALEECGLLNDAVAAYRTALRLSPDDIATLLRFGRCFLVLGRLEPAAASFERVCSLEPANAAAHNNLGVVRLRQGRWDNAEAWLRKAVVLDPRSADAATNLGTAFHEQGRFQAALDAYEAALALSPGAADAHWNRALLWLRHGDFERGWSGYEWRWQRPAHVDSEFRRPPDSVPARRCFTRRQPALIDVPCWRGESLDGQAVLFFAEQGLGDTLQFMRFLLAAKQRGARTVVECQRPLVPLLRHAPAVDVVVGQGDELPNLDFQLPLLSLPKVLRVTREQLAANVPYLQAAAELVEHWRPTIRSIDAVRIGVAWQGNPGYAGDGQRSLPLSSFAPLAKLKGVQLVSLQRKVGVDQIVNVRDWFEVIDLGPEVDTTNGAFVDTAAIMQHLDLVVTSDSALPHLAGALGIETWLVLPHVSDWRWGVEGDTTPWYPSMRLFRQRKAGDWADVFRRVANALQARLDSRAP